MKLWLKLLLTGISLVLIFAGGIDAGITTIPGLAMLGWIWGFEATTQ